MLERAAADGLLVRGRPVVVLYSGGRDSTCLLDLASSIAGAGAVTALHVNYGLREAAEEDERHCAAVCERLAVPLELRHPRRPESGNVQAWARDERYGAAAALALELDGDVASAHTATDQIETILYRLASSPSRRALLGMRPRDGRLVRPLLHFTREDTTAWCRERGLGWRDDASNDSDDYARGRIRSTLVPALRAVHPAAERNVLALAAFLRDEAEVLDGLVDDALSGRDEIAVAALRSMPPALRRLVVQRLADRASVSGLAPGAARRTDEIAALQDGGALDIGSGVRATVRGGVVRFGPTPTVR
ncbi:MAG TPA: tRNA lysidine(34) synthetase TilS [Solirubrobacteraceae bacterium]|nr:tRNA lysidine(34) synthetase TilS [Solirubrobacteraceae bacterium]